MKLRIADAEEMMIIEDDALPGDLILFTSIVLVKDVVDDSANVEVVVNSMSIINTSGIFEKNE